MLRGVVVALAVAGLAVSAASAERPMSLDDALREHADALRKPIDCGSTPSGDRWRILKFNLHNRHLVFAELVRRRPDGGLERIAAGGFELFNEDGLRRLARGVRCKPQGDLVVVSARAVDDRNGETYGYLSAELAPDGKVIEYLGPIVVSGGT
jgi:hypothetical protein